jgi:hypothetical protein
MVTHWRVDPYAHTSCGNSITALVNGNAGGDLRGSRAFENEWEWPQSQQGRPGQARRRDSGAFQPVRCLLVRLAQNERSKPGVLSVFNTIG